MRALITGASSGIGYSMAKYLAVKNIDLILVARRKNRLLELKKEFKNIDIEIIPLDLSIEDNLEVLVNSTIDKDIDILINNAGFGLFGTFDSTDLETEMKMIDVNIRAVHYLTKSFLKKFIKEDKGYILNVASSAGFMAGPKLSTYYATKNYCLRLSEAIYQELKEKKSNVHISVLCPGPVDTEFNTVAHGVFKTKSATPEYVAKYAVDKMFKNKLLIIPTIKMKMAIFLIRFVPTKLLLHITSNIQERKISK
ncbi:MAG: SDR family oxidoreductase [Bacilli bacterium]|nr:SDR family oxidoreductase [Bacilli bacterium]